MTCCTVSWTIRTSAAPARYVRQSARPRLDSLQHRALSNIRLRAVGGLPQRHRHADRRLRPDHAAHPRRHPPGNRVPHPPRPAPRRVRRRRSCRRPRLGVPKHAVPNPVFVHGSRKYPLRPHRNGLRLPMHRDIRGGRPHGMRVCGNACGMGEKKPGGIVIKSRFPHTTIRTQSAPKEQPPAAVIFTYPAVLCPKKFFPSLLHPRCCNPAPSRAARQDHSAPDSDRWIKSS